MGVGASTKASPGKLGRPPWVIGAAARFDILGGGGQGEPSCIDEACLMMRKTSCNLRTF